MLVSIIMYGSFVLMSYFRTNIYDEEVRDGIRSEKVL